MAKKLIALRIKESEHKALEKLVRAAKDEEVNVSSLIRQAIREFLQRRKE